MSGFVNLYKLRQAWDPCVGMSGCKTVGPSYSHFLHTFQRWVLPPLVLAGAHSACASQQYSHPTNYSWPIWISFPNRQRCLVVQPICTYEIGRLASKYDELQAENVKIAALSMDSVSPSMVLVAWHPYFNLSSIKYCVDRMLLKFHAAKGGSPCMQVASNAKWLRDVLAQFEKGVRLSILV